MHRTAAESAALVADYYAAFNRGDRAAMLALLAEDVAHDLNQGARETGKPAFAAFMARMDASYRERRKDIAVMASADGMRAVAECRGARRLSPQRCRPARSAWTGLCAVGRGVLRHPRRAHRARHQQLPPRRLDRPGLVSASRKE